MIFRIPFLKSICWLLIYSTVWTPAFVSAQEAGIVKFVHGDAVFAAIARPRRVLTANEMRMLPIEVISAAGEQELGIDPVDVESILLVAQPPTNGPPAGGVVVRFSKPFDMNNLSENLLQLSQPAEHKGRPVRKGIGEMTPWMAMADNRTLVIALQPAFDEMLKASESDKLSPLGAKLQQDADKLDLKAILEFHKIRPLADMMLAQAPPIPEPFDIVLDVPKLTEEIELGFGMIQSQSASLILTARNEADAMRMKAVIAKTIDGVKAMILEEMASEQTDDPIELAGQQYAKRMLNMVIDEYRPQREGKSLKVVAEGGQSSQMATIGILVALLLPAVQAAREAARRAQAINIIKQLSIAMINYESAHGHFPARANFDENGKPLLSWRVHMLPYMEEQAIYRQFKLDEPWDSEHNRKLIDKMPEIYQNPNLPRSNKTNFLVPVGPGTLFEGNKGIKVRQVKDGISKTLMIVEADANQAVIWTKPEDLKHDPENPHNGLGGLRPGGFVGGHGDGAVSFFANTLDNRILRAFFTYKGGDRTEGP